jgi:hypothetical protein
MNRCFTRLPRLRLQWTRRVSPSASASMRPRAVIVPEDRHDPGPPDRHLEGRQTVRRRCCDGNSRRVWRGTNDQRTRTYVCRRNDRAARRRRGIAAGICQGEMFELVGAAPLWLPNAHANVAGARRATSRDQELGPRLRGSIERTSGRGREQALASVSRPAAMRAIAVLQPRLAAMRRSAVVDPNDRQRCVPAMCSL